MSGDQLGGAGRGRSALGPCPPGPPSTHPRAAAGFVDRPALNVAAFFDVDGTLTRSDIFRDLVAFRNSVRPDKFFDLTLPLRGLSLLALDQVSRLAVNRLTYSWLEGFRREDYEAWVARFQEGPGRRRLLQAPLSILADHARRGHRIVLLTGAVDLLVAPLPDLFARVTGVDACRAIRVEAVPLEVRDGVFTGKLAAPPLGGEEKARRIRAIATEEGLDLPGSYAYGDSIADLPMLEAVGRPAAIRPDWRLRREAHRRGWPVLRSSTLHEVS